MAIVNDLPATNVPITGTIPVPVPLSGQATGGIHKEVEHGVTPIVEAPALREIGQDVELPPEVSSIGVKAYPTTVVLPPSVSQMGVTPMAAPVAVAPVVPMPLTDAQIAQGLKQSMSSSWRWLAEWCVKRLKQLHKTITKKGT